MHYDRNKAPALQDMEKARSEKVDVEGGASRSVYVSAPVWSVYGSWDSSWLFSITVLIVSGRTIRLESPRPLQLTKSIWTVLRITDYESCTSTIDIFSSRIWRSCLESSRSSKSHAPNAQTYPHTHMYSKGSQALDLPSLFSFFFWEFLVTEKPFPRVKQRHIECAFWAT
jgi:hypothetical protein